MSVPEPRPTVELKVNETILTGCPNCRETVTLLVQLNHHMTPTLRGSKRVVTSLLSSESTVIHVCDRKGPRNE